MDTKLTLKLNDGVISRAKKYARGRKISLSKMVENYLNSITSAESGDFEISPFVKSISDGKGIPADTDWKTVREDYVRHLEKKYQ